MQIEAKNLTYIYSQGIVYERIGVKDINLSVEKGEFIGLIGHTGSGKSTLVQLLNGLLTPTSGNVFIDGEDIFIDKKNMKEVHRKVGLIFQYPEHQLFETTVYKDVAFGPKNLGLSEAEVKERVCEALELVKIPESYYEKSPFELSGGQKRRAAIAGVLSMKPDILILDEPTAGLDPVSKAEILSEVENLKRKKTIILISHIMDDIARLSDRIVVLEKGEIALMGTPEEIFSKSGFLKQIGLSPTRSSELLILLKERGMNVDVSKYTPESAAEEILKAANIWGRS